MQVQILGMEPAVPHARSLIVQSSQPRLEVLRRFAQISLTSTIEDNTRCNTKVSIQRHPGAAIVRAYGANSPAREAPTITHQK